VEVVYTFLKSDVPEARLSDFEFEWFVAESELIRPVPRRTLISLPISQLKP
jgi:hypothetical protein